MSTTDFDNNGIRNVHEDVKIHKYSATVFDVLGTQFLFYNYIMTYINLLTIEYNEPG